MSDEGTQLATSDTGVWFPIAFTTLVVAVVTTLTTMVVTSEMRMNLPDSRATHESPLPR